LPAPAPASAAQPAAAAPAFPAATLAEIRRATAIVSALAFPLDAELVDDIVAFFAPGRDESEVVSSAFNIDMKVLSFRRLRPGGWLDDESINFIMALLQDRAFQKESRGCRGQRFFSSFHMAKAAGIDTRKRVSDTFNYSEVSRWTKDVNVFLCSGLFFPVNSRNAHWGLLHIDMDHFCIYYLDSKVDLVEYHQTASFFLEAALEWLAWESADNLLKPLDKSAWKRIKLIVPQQDDGSSCGVCTVLNAVVLRSEGVPLLYDSTHLPAVRLALAAAIRSASLWSVL
jgi:Ulp1 family protease